MKNINKDTPVLVVLVSAFSAAFLKRAFCLLRFMDYGQNNRIFLPLICLLVCLANKKAKLSHNTEL